MQKKKKEKKENSERWLLTYSDLITLLMILFILLFAMSNVNQEKYDKLSVSLNESLGGGKTIINGTTGIIGLEGSGTGMNGTDEPTPEPTQTPTPTPTPTQEPQAQGNTQGQTGEPSGSLTSEKDMENLQSYIDDVVDNLEIGDYVSTSIKSTGMFITFSNDVFFDSGDDTLKDDMKMGLNKLSVLLNRIDNTIVVEGHTDNIPMNKSSSKFASNWQLSAARAANVVEYLVDNCKIDGTRISAVGYGEFHPKDTNQTEKGRSKNRRIDVVILYN